MLNMHEIFNLEVASAADMTIELGFTPSEVIVSDKADLTNFTKWVVGTSATTGISLSDPKHVFYNNASTPTYKDENDVAVANTIVDLEGNSVLDRRLPALSTATSPNSYVVGKGIALDVSALGNDFTGDTILISVKR